MAKEYKEISLSRSSYQRGRTLIFENPKHGSPSLLIKEEKVHTFPNKEITEPSGEIRKVINDLSVIFPIRNPLTNDIIERAVGVLPRPFHLALQSVLASRRGKRQSTCSRT